MLLNKTVQLAHTIQVEAPQQLLDFCMYAVGTMGGIVSVSILNAYYLFVFHISYSCLLYISCLFASRTRTVRKCFLLLLPLF